MVLCPPGAGIKTIKNPLRHAFYAEQGFIRFEFEIHGLNPAWSEEMFQEISRAFNGAENGYLTYGLDNRDNYYMKRVYLACIRCIDFLTALPEWDGKNVIVQGASQGGALALVTAALDKRVTLCAASHPALSLHDKLQCLPFSHGDSTTIPALPQPVTLCITRWHVLKKP